MRPGKDPLDVRGMTQFRPQGPVTPAGAAAFQAASTGPVEPAPSPDAAALDPYDDTLRPWQDMLVGTIRSEIDQGRRVSASLPGSQRPVLIEDVERRGPLVFLTGLQDAMYIIGDMAGVVVLSDPQPGSVRWPKHASAVSMGVDQPVIITRFNRSGEIKRDGLDEKGHRDGEA